MTTGVVSGEASVLMLFNFVPRMDDVTVNGLPAVVLLPVIETLTVVAEPALDAPKSVVPPGVE